MSLETCTAKAATRSRDVHHERRGRGRPWSTYRARARLMLALEERFTGH